MERYSMREYDVYFEIYGKKMRTRVVADSDLNAKLKVAKSIKWHKVKPINDPIVDFFNREIFKT